MASQTPATCNVCYDTFDPRAMIVCNASEACSFTMCPECTSKCGLQPCNETQCMKLHWQCPACRQGCNGLEMMDARLTVEMINRTRTTEIKKVADEIESFPDSLEQWFFVCTKAVLDLYEMCDEKDNETTPTIEEVMNNKTIEEMATMMANMRKGARIISNFKTTLKERLGDAERGAVESRDRALKKLHIQRAATQIFVGRFIADIWDTAEEVVRTIAKLQATNKAKYTCGEVGEKMRKLVDSMGAAKENLRRMGYVFQGHGSTIQS
jgi:hypothetical protein